MIAKSQYKLKAADAELLLALVRSGTLAAAAGRMHADASTVFRHLQRIEKGLGTRLFERGRSGYLPTEAMQAISTHAERIESELEAARSVASRPHDEVTGRVRLSTTDSVQRGLVLPCIPALAQRHPSLQLELRSTNELVSLTHRDADLALRATPKPPLHVIGRHLGTIRFTLCVERSRASACRRRPMSSLPWIAPDEALPDHPTVSWRHRYEPKVVPQYVVDGISAVVDAVKLGLGIGAVPLFMLEAEPQLAPLGDPLEDCQSELWLLAHPESRHLRRIAAVYQHLSEHIRLR